MLINLGRESVTLAAGDRVAQLILERAALVDAEMVHELPPASTKRGTGGFGSTGLTEPVEQARESDGVSRPPGLWEDVEMEAHSVTGNFETCRRTKPFGQDGGKQGLQRKLAAAQGR